ncbi:hypothetical protein E4U43_007586 [Claviceps pusilla]|uniref:Peptidase A1 domain-containing protein n=1 Tax=Claviceps pusilla TaxID=123648 RepID=A0A9P7T1G5_9HYPO|nr:hypothetical protein E4U43_007586 [Claviceps pusilla]
MKASIAATVFVVLAEGAVTGTWDSSTTREQQASKSGGGKEFSLHQIKNRRFTGRDGVMAFARAHLKYTQKLPDSLLKAINVNSQLRSKFAALNLGGVRGGTVQTQPTYGSDSEYAVEVGLGTPPQPIPLNMDTGSADFWTFSSDTDPQMVNDQALYHPEHSSTSKLIDGDSWSIRYGDGAGASGIVYDDAVQVGNMHVPHQAIESATYVSGDLAHDNFVSGIIGLANSSANTISPEPRRTFFDNIRDELARPLFTANLRSQAPGNYNFGFIDREEYTGVIHYTPIDRDSPLWKIAVSGYWVGYSKYQSTIDAIVDTGTSLTLLPQSVVDDFYAQVRGSYFHPELGAMVLPCSARVPDFWVTIGPYNGRLPGRYVKYARINSRYCYGGIQSSSNLPFSVLGDVFLKAQFVVFDYGNAAVGFANKKLHS